MNRTDGYKIRSDDPMYQIVPHIMPTRADASNNIRLDIDMAPIQDYIKKRRKEGRSVSHMSVIVAAYIRTVSQNPYLNRFVVNKKIYARNHLCVSFVTLIPQTGGETVNKVYFNLDDTIDIVNEKINKVVESSTVAIEDNAMDRFAGTLLAIPGLLRIGVVLLKALDKVFSMPFWAINGSPFHTSLFITNLASIRTNAVHHHLYEFGTTGVFIAMGQPEMKTYINDDGEADEKKIMELCITTDERIASGSYFGRCFKVISKYLKNPELLETPPEQVIKDPDIICKHPKWICK